MSYKIKNWDKFKHFKDRQPVWIRLYRDLLDDYNVSSLSDEAFRFLINLCLLASEDVELQGNLPTPETISFRLRLNKNKVLQLLKEVDNFLLSDCYQEDNNIEVVVKERRVVGLLCESDALEYVRSLARGKAYGHIEADRELTKMLAWIGANPGRKLTKRFIVNWLNRIEAPKSNTDALLVRA